MTNSRRFLRTLSRSTFVTLAGITVGCGNLQTLPPPPGLATAPPEPAPPTDPQVAAPAPAVDPAPAVPTPPPAPAVVAIAPDPAPVDPLGPLDVPVHRPHHHEEN